MKANDEKYPKARYDFDTNPQIYGFKVGKTYRFRDFGRGVEVFYDDGCSLAMGYNMFNECFTKIMETNESPEKIYIQPNAHDGWFECNPQSDIFIEYARTDAFIEKAARWLNYKLFDRVEVVKFGTTLESIMSKEEFVDDFKKFMKGE